MVDNRFNNKRRIGAPYIDLARDIREDLSKNHLLYKNEEDFLEHVKSRMDDRKKEEAFRWFMRNYRSWLRRHVDK